MDWSPLWTLFEPLNLALLALCVFLLYKIRGPSSEGGDGQPAERKVEKVKGNLTVRQLLAYDGKNPDKPILLAVCGVIYDVTRGKDFYGPGGPYEILAGHDGTRALALMSTDPEHAKDVDDDHSDLTPGQMATAKDWQQSFHYKYDYVGELVKAESDQVSTAATEGKGDCTEAAESGPSDN